MDRWLQQTGNAGGARVPLAQVWRLSRAWYQDPRGPAWKARTLEESQAVLAATGLAGSFWELQPK